MWLRAKKERWIWGKALIHRLWWSLWLFQSVVGKIAVIPWRSRWWCLLYGSCREPQIACHGARQRKARRLLGRSRKQQTHIVDETYCRPTVAVTDRQDSLPQWGKKKNPQLFLPPKPLSQGDGNKSWRIRSKLVSSDRSLEFSRILTLNGVLHSHV